MAKGGRGQRWTDRDLANLRRAGSNHSRGMAVTVPFIAQPNNYSCGPTCIAMIAKAVRAPSRELPPKVIGEFAGTNPKTGTTEVEMARGLTFAGLAWRRGTARSIEQLDLEFSRNNLVILRTLIGQAKHWVVVSDRQSGRFSVMCPTTGADTWSDQVLLQRWAARDYDHFLVPAAPIAHQPQTRPIHQMTLESFTNYGRVVRDVQQDGREERMIASTAQFLERCTIDPLHQTQTTYQGWRYYRVPSNGMGVLLAEHESQPDVIAGGIQLGTTYIRPEFRGRGGAVGLLLAAYRDPPHIYLRPSYFSEGGYATRVRAHAVAVQQALDAGLEVEAQVVRSNPLLTQGATSGPRYLDRTPAPSQTTWQATLDFGAPKASPPRREDEDIDAQFGQLFR